MTRVSDAPSMRVWPLYRTLVGVGMVCALLIAAVVVATQPVIENNRDEALRQAVFAVLPESVTVLALRFDERTGAFRPQGHDGEEHGKQFYAGYNQSEQMVGVALMAQGQGYQDRIRVLYGYAPARQSIIGIRVLESRETPGLGDKIATDPGFLANFTALDVSLSSSGQRLANAIAAVKSGQKRAPWQVDGITGATISSEAIAVMLNASARQWVPKLYAQRQQLEQWARQSHDD